MALVEKVPRSASVTSDGASKLMVLGRRDFFRVVRSDHDLGVKLLWALAGVLSERLRRTSRELGDARAEIAQLSVPELS
jgi:CRP-like cAMP-binding protein